MSKAVMISIRPRWCELIAAGEKTMEVRKTRPKLETPFKCYIYCTSGNDKLWIADAVRRNWWGNTHVAHLCNAKNCGGMNLGNRKVIGEFVCDRIDRLVRIGCTGSTEKQRYRTVDDWQNAHNISRLLESACLTEGELETYLKGDTGFGWHISDLKIYSRPVDIANFHSCLGCEYVGDCDTYCWDPVRIPPQSWRYVEQNEGVLN